MNCLACGKPMPDDVAFCPYCGRQCKPSRPAEPGPDLQHTPRTASSARSTEVAGRDIKKKEIHYHPPGAQPGADRGDRCDLCGQYVPLESSIICRTCNRLVCRDDFNRQRRRCIECAPRDEDREHPAGGERSRREAPVSINGAGSFNSVEDACHEARPGATVRLSAGIHRLSRPLQVEKALVLVGDGMDRTRLVCEDEGYVARFVGSGRFAARDLAFEHHGPRWARVLEVSSGEVELRRCRFVGGVRDEPGGRGGSGLRLLGEASGIVAECESAGNGLFGILVEGLAAPTLEANTCHGNADAGIGYFSKAAGVARRNSSYGNGTNGIAVVEEAHPSLEHNDCRANGHGGIAYAGKAAGAALHNCCIGNGNHGISVMDQARPTLEHNTCRGNRWDGIGYGRTAGGVACHNDCHENEHHGIGLGDQAGPTLELNLCRDNGWHGIAYAGSAAGIARRNACAGNSRGSIFLGDQAHPILDGNEEEPAREEQPPSSECRRPEESPSTRMEATMSNPHHEHDLAIFEREGDLAQLIGPETVVIVTGCWPGCELLDRPVAEMLRDEIDRRGKPHPCRRGVVIGDMWWWKDPNLYPHPVISVGGPAANSLTTYLVEKGEKWEVEGVQGSLLLRESVPQVALWGQGPRQTRESVERYVQQPEGLAAFLKMCWG